MDIKPNSSQIKKHFQGDADVEIRTEMSGGVLKLSAETETDHDLHIQ